MQNFPVKRLPLSLRNEIFDHCRPEELTKFLGVNVELRQLVLNNGPLTKRLLAIDICGPDIMYQPETPNWWVSLDLATYHNSVIHLYIGEQRRFVAEDVRIEIDGLESGEDEKDGEDERELKILEKDLKTLFKAGFSCQKMGISHRDNGAPEVITKLFNHLPKLSYLSDLLLDVQDFGVVPAILESLCTNRIDEIELILGYDNELPLVSGIYDFVRKNLAECEKANQNGTSIEAAHSNYAALQNTSIKKVQMFMQGSNFPELVKMIFAKGLPSEHPEFHLVLYNREGDMDVLKDFKGDLPKWDEIVEDQAVRNWFWKEMGPHGQESINELPHKDLIRRKITKKLEHFYLICVEDDHPSFYALSHPIA